MATAILCISIQIPNEPYGKKGYRLGHLGTLTLVSLLYIIIVATQMKHINDGRNYIIQ